MLTVQSIDEVQHYWDTHASSLTVPGASWGSPQFFAAIKSDHDQVYSYANQILGLSSLRGRSLLEIGCGIGLDTVEFVRHGAQVTAIDLSPTCIHLTKRFLTYHKLSATVGVGNAEQLDYPENSFDLVVARAILMFTPNGSRVVDEIFRVLRPGGVAQILLHNRFSWYALLARASGTPLVDETCDPPVNKLYSVWQVPKLFSQFSSYKVFYDRYPRPSGRRSVVAKLYNKAFVPLVHALPKSLIRTAGYYMIVNAIK